MNDIDKMPVKCRDCPYWGLAVYPWCCGDCKDRLKKPVGDFVSRQWLIDEYHRRHEGPPGGALKMIEEAPAADVEPKRKWIPVTDPENLPKRSTPCLVACNQWGGETVRKATWLASERIFHEHGRDITEYVTHWMDLPRAPEEVRHA